MDPKLQLSTFEAELVGNSDWILTKNNIIGKAQKLLGVVQENMMDYIRSKNPSLPADVLSRSAKISRGENYRGLPWLMLDYPRYFEKENMFAIRTMFWWGNFFSTTLHLSGKFKIEYSNNILANFDKMKEQNYFCSIHEDPWQHHIDKDNYKALSEFSKTGFEEHLQQKDFLKLSKTISLSEWEHAIQLLSDEFVRMIGWLN